VLGICDSSVEERTSSEHRNLLYLYPPNITSGRAADEIDGVEIVDVEVNYNMADGRLITTVLKVFQFLSQADLGTHVCR